jgi:hypothetical protein
VGWALGAILYEINDLPWILKMSAWEEHPIGFILLAAFIGFLLGMIAAYFVYRELIQDFHHQNNNVFLRPTPCTNNNNNHHHHHHNHSSQNRLYSSSSLSQLHMQLPSQSQHQRGLDVGYTTPPPKYPLSLGGLLPHHNLYDDINDHDDNMDHSCIPIYRANTIEQLKCKQSGSTDDDYQSYDAHCRGIELKTPYLEEKHYHKNNNHNQLSTISRNIFSSFSSNISSPRARHKYDRIPDMTTTSIAS